MGLTLDDLLQVLSDSVCLAEIELSLGAEQETLDEDAAFIFGQLPTCCFTLKSGDDLAEDIDGLRLGLRPE